MNRQPRGCICPRIALRATYSKVAELEYEAEEDDDDAVGEAPLRSQDLQAGQELMGVVTDIKTFGVFVDIGMKREGLVHISKLSSGRVANAADVVELGQKVKVWVRSVDDEGKIWLTMVHKDGVTKHDCELFAKVTPDQWLPGIVEAISDFGIFVKVKPPERNELVQGMVHVSNIKDGFVEHPSEEAAVGQEVKVRVLAVFPDTGRISLSMKPYVQRDKSTTVRADTQDVSAMVQIPPTVWLTGRVSSVQPYGAFVEVQVPGGSEKVQGLVHKTEIKDGFVDDPSKELKENQEVQVRVLSTNVAIGRIQLSMLRIENSRGSTPY